MQNIMNYSLNPLEGYKAEENYNRQFTKLPVSVDDCQLFLFI